MDEKDLRITNLRAQVDGQEQTIREQAEEITSLRRQLVEITEQLEDAAKEMRETMMAVQELIDRYAREWNMADYIRGERQKRRNGT